MLARTVVPLAAAALVLGSCANREPNEPQEARADSSVSTEGAEAFAREAFGAFDAAAACDELRLVWDRYLHPTLTAEPNPVLQCTAAVLAVEHTVGSAEDWQVDTEFTPTGVPPEVLRDAEQVRTLGVVSDQPFDLAGFPATGWMVVTDESGTSLFNEQIYQVVECLRIAETCRISG